MKAKFFTAKFFFTVVVVFAVICMFVVFFGVVRANASVLSQPNVGAVNGGLAIHRLVGAETAIALHDAVAGNDRESSIVACNLHDQVDCVPMHADVAVVTNMVLNRHEVVANNVATDNVENV